MRLECQHGQLARKCPLCERDEEIVALKERIAELEDAQTWRSMDSAPKDGTDMSAIQTVMVCAIVGVIMAFSVFVTALVWDIIRR